MADTSHEVSALLVIFVLRFAFPFSRRPLVQRDNYKHELQN